MRYTNDVGRGDWIRSRLRDWSTILGVVPSGFEAYARVFHPVGLRWIDRHDGWPPSWPEQSLSWAETATRLGAIAHPLMQWGSIYRGRPDLGPEEDGWQWTNPNIGALPAIELAAASAVLAEHTSTPDRCIAALWEGWGWAEGTGVVAAFTMSEPDSGENSENDDTPATFGWAHSSAPAFPPEVLTGPRLELPQRAYLLFETAASELMTPDWDVPNPGNDWPNLLWPEDHAWCLASEIDFDSTLVGGSRALVDALLAAEGLEVAELSPDASLQWDADTVNGPPPRPFVD